MVHIMEKYKPCLDLEYPKPIWKKSDLFPLLSPTLHFSSTPPFHHSMRLTKKMTAKNTVIPTNCRNSDTSQLALYNPEP
jgi:hypothetical protein